MEIKKTATRSGKYLLLSGMIGMSAFSAYALPSVTAASDASAIVQQTAKLTGVIVDAKTGDPIIGANVLIKGTTNGTITNIDGEYTLEAPVGSSLLVSYIGYKTIELKAAAGKQTIKLQEDTETLDEVIVVGYTTQRKESLTGAMQNLKSEKLKDVTSPSVENMLSGKVPGVQVTPGSGQPGSTGAITIRGQASLSGNTKPLWVIDGVIVGDGAYDLNPSDIENMTILKDAASTAIYGSQGANGVIVVTTKNGRAEKMKLNVNAKLGISTLNRGNMDMMNGAELYDYYQSFENQEKILFERYTPALRNDNFDWYDLAKQTGFAQDYNITLQGGTEKIQSFLSLNLYNETGAVKGYDYKRYNFRFKTNYKPFNWLTIKPAVSGSRRDVDNKQYDTTSMFQRLPWDSPYDKDGNLVEPHYPGWVNTIPGNYLYDLELGNKSASTNYEVMANLDFDIKITDWLTFSSVNNYRWIGYSSNSYTDPRCDSASGVNGRITEYQSNTVRRYTNHKLLFNKMFGKHSVNALLAYEFNDYWLKTLDVAGTGFISGFEVLDVTSKPEKTRGGISEWAVQSYFFNGNYAYDSKYLAQVSLRRDGASNFGDNKKYGNFFSISGGWNINRESWFKADWVDNLKVRIAYGSVGNRPSSLYPQYDLYSASSKYNEASGALISQIGNKDLTWEKTYTFGVGLDAAFFANRLRFNFDWYDKRTDNILYMVPISGLAGVTSIWKNVGKMKNTGIEMTIGGDIVRTQDWTWSIEANIGHNKNELTDIYKQKDTNGNMVAKPVIVGDNSGIAGAASRILEIGEPIDTYWLKEWAGVDTETGAPLWYMDEKDANGNVTGRTTTSSYSKASYYKCGTSNPKFFGGFNTSLNYKNFDLSAVFGYSLGGHIFNYNRIEYDSDGAYTDRNQMKLQDGWTRWEKPGDVATHPKAVYGNTSNSNKASSRFIESNDYLKLRSLTLGYTFKLPDYGIQNVRLYFTGENLLTFSGYSGVDPEVPVTSGGQITGTSTPGIYPTVRKFMFGLNLSF